MIISTPTNHPRQSKLPAVLYLKLFISSRIEYFHLVHVLQIFYFTPYFFNKKKFKNRFNAMDHQALPINMIVPSV